MTLNHFTPEYPFTRRAYKDLLLESLRYCQLHKGLELYAYVIMPNHVHLIAGVAEGGNLSGVMRDLKKFTSAAIIKAIRENPQESRRDWMLWLFRSEGQHNPPGASFRLCLFAIKHLPYCRRAALFITFPSYKHEV